LADDSPFRRIARKAVREVDIETLFQDLQNRSNIPGLLSHQADILRNYHAHHVSTPDVGLEIPTGTGKTLVGLLIAEWRRQMRHERVVYLCPTKQLANQVALRSRDYGISTRVFTGPKREYDRQDFALYQKAETIAITTYSGLFNTSPGIKDPQLIVLDDAHSSEANIASMWSLAIHRNKTPELYSEILSIFEKDLPVLLVTTLHSQIRPKTLPKAEAIPLGSLYRNIDSLRKKLSGTFEAAGQPINFPWTVIRDSMIACQMYVTWDQILIRPYIPPTLTHTPFAGANQRVYMSATIGQGGELERMTGVRRIERIPTPKAYMSRGIGRRLFLFPDMAANPEQYYEWIAKIIGSQKHSLILSPTNRLDDVFKSILSQYSPSVAVMGSLDIEETLNPFLENEPSALVLANRYDGLDIPDGKCRILVLNGLPTGTNLQETFLEERLGLEILLRERTKTRITQGAGRCTRSANDYVAIIMAGAKLLEFCLKYENRKLFHPELRAELTFAFEQNSKDFSNLDAMLDVFLKHDDRWRLAEQDLAHLRTDVTTVSAAAILLSQIVKDEVDFCYAMWQGDFKKAVQSGKKVADLLSDPKLSTYRALWYYFVAAAAQLASIANKEYEGVVSDYSNRAMQASKTNSWFPNATKSLQTQVDTRVAGELDIIAMEGIEEILTELGASGPKFQRKLDEINEMVGSTDPKKFDRGMVELGRLMGFDSWKPQEEAGPDCVWQLESKVAFLLEGKSEEAPDGPVSVENCRQATGHLRWAAFQDKLKYCGEVFSVLVTPREKIEPMAVPHGQVVFVCGPKLIKELFDRSTSMLTSIRDSMTDADSEDTRQRILQEIISRGLKPQSIQSLLLSSPATSLPNSKPKRS
jgi:hypothetical protein